MKLRCLFARRSMCVRSGTRMLGLVEPFSGGRVERLTGHQSPGSRPPLKGFFTSIRMINAVVASAPVHGGEYLLLLCMARYAADDGTRVFPSVGTLARDSRQEERSVFRQLRSLASKGLIVRVGVSSHSTVNYRIAIEKLAPPPDLRSPAPLTQERNTPDLRAKTPDRKSPDSSSIRQENRQELLATPHVKPVSYAVEMVLKALKNRPVKESP